MGRYISKPGEKRPLTGWELHLKNTISIAGALYLIFAVMFYPEPILHRSIAFGMFFSVIFLSYATPGVKAASRIPVSSWIMALLSVGVSVYIAINFNRISERIVFVDQVTALDIFFGIATLFLLVEGGRRILGPWLPALGLLGLAYAVFGHLIPGKFGHVRFSLDYMIDGMFLSDYGVWGSTMGVATGQIMVFIMFATLLQTTGASDFLFDFVAKTAGKYKGGIGKVAVVSSAMFGMISGGGMTNVSTTGAMTIPMMKKSGYTKEYAACIESAASTGGVFMPPVMGSVAFLMSDLVGIPYAEVLRRAFLPALVYFMALFFSVDFKSRRDKISGIIDIPKDSLFKLFMKGYSFFIPLTFLVYRLAAGRPAAKAGLETIGLMLIIGFLNPRNRLNLKKIMETLKKAVSRGLIIISTMATCGILIGSMDLTGITSKFSTYLTSVANVSSIITLLLVMVMTLFLGLAMGASSTYLIAAVLGAPVLIGLGYPPLGVHMFILFYAAMASVTPPVALTSYTAASIAGADPMKVGWMSMRVGMVGYIMPFIFVINPAIIQIGTIPGIALAFCFAIAGVGILALGLEGWFFGLDTSIPIRILLVCSGFMIMPGNLVLSGFGGSMLVLTGTYCVEENNFKQ